MILSLKYLSVFIFLLFVSAKSTSAQNGALDVQTIEEGSYIINFDGVAGVTRSEAGLKVMAVGCDMARERGARYLSVTGFMTGEHSSRVLARRGGTTGRVGQDGALTDVTTTQNEYSTVTNGWASFGVVLVSTQTGLGILENVTDIVDVASRTIRSNGPY